MPNVFAFVATVLMLFWMGFFMLGSLPLLVLKHDTPLDARFIRGLFDVYYKALIVTSSAAALAFIFTGGWMIAAGLGAVCGGAVVTRHHVLGQMDRLRNTMTPEDSPRIRQFRRLHIAGMVLNVGQLLGICLVMVWVV